MTDGQRVIKYCALGFAIFLIVTIFSGLIFGIKSLQYVFSEDDDDDYRDYNTTVNEVNEYFDSLEIELKATKFRLKESNEFKIETNNDNIAYSQKNGKLYIKEKKFHHTKKSYELVIYMPREKILDDFELDAGAGNVNIEILNTRTGSFDLGAGKLSIDDINVTGSLDIDGGAGEVDIRNGNINNLDLEMGVGKLSFKSKLTGSNDIDLGVGSSNITLIGSEFDYRIRANKGVGSFEINREKVSDGTIYGNGNTSIDVDGGVGKIEIEFE